MAKPKNQKQAPKPAAAPVEKIAGKVRDLSGIVDRIRARVKNSGFIRDALDPRDFCASRLFPRGLQLPISTANRPNYSPVEDQSTLGSCTAQAGVGIAEMLDRLPDGAHVDRITSYNVCYTKLCELNYVEYRSYQIRIAATRQKF